MNNNIVFDFFSDSQATTIAKLGNYLHMHPSEIEKALVYGCSAESFINDLRIDLLAYDRSVVSIIGRHVTTSAEDMQSFYRTGLLDLRASLQQDTPLSHFLTKHNIIIDIESFLFIRDAVSQLKDESVPTISALWAEKRLAVGRLDVKHSNSLVICTRNSIN